MGGPDLAPHASQRSERPGVAVTLLDYRVLGGRLRLMASGLVESAPM